MTQASDLGGVANQLAAFYRARVNVNLQALATQHYGASEPPLMYPNMIWFDSGTGSIKIRNPTNTAWESVGTIGPPMKWTNVDIPQTAFTTGDVKMTWKTVADSGWVIMNDGTIGDGSSGATTRANPDTQALFTLLWSSQIDDWMQVYAAGTLTRTGRGASAASDWAAHRHILLPKVLGRTMAVAGTGAGISGKGLSTWEGAETIALGIGNIPSHAHTVSIPDHTHPGAPSGSSVIGGGGGFSSAYGTGGSTGPGGAFSGNTGAAGSGAPFFKRDPVTYVNAMIKL